MDIINAWKKLVDEATCPAEFPFVSEWVSFGKGYPVKGLGGSHTPMIAHEMIELDVDYARHILLLYLRSCLREEDGMLAAMTVAKSDSLYPKTEKGRIYQYSHPPIWSFVAKKILEKKWDPKFAEFCFNAGMMNLKWWEENRKDRIGLFWYIDSYPDEKNSESGYENSPRWDFKDLGPFPCIDLSCLILLYIENLIWLADKLAQHDKKNHLVLSHQNLKKIMDRYFWDEIIGIFCDYDLLAINAKKTTASFFSLVSGLAMTEDVERMIGLLLDPKEFSAPKGMPVVSMAEPAFELDLWRGTLSPSEVFWVCLGLQRYGYLEVAKNIAKTSLENIYDTFKNTGKLWEFYNPVDGDMSKLKRKGSKKGPYPDCPGSVPVISIEKIAEGENLW